MTDLLYFKIGIAILVFIAARLAQKGEGLAFPLVLVTMAIALERLP